MRGGGSTYVEEGEPRSKFTNEMALNLRGGLALDKFKKGREGAIAIFNAWGLVLKFERGLALNL